MVSPLAPYILFFSSETFLGKKSPRSTGSSRTLLLILIISFFIFNDFLKKNNFLKFMTYILISTLILLFQSRTTFVLLITFILLNYIYQKNFSVKSTVKYFFTHILMPILFLYIILYSKEFFHNNEIFRILANQGLKSSLVEITNNFQRPIDPDTYSSGRFKTGKILYQKLMVHYSMVTEHKVIDF